MTDPPVSLRTLCHIVNVGDCGSVTDTAAGCGAGAMIMPVLLPTLIGLDVDPVHLDLLIVMTPVMGQVTPPLRSRFWSRPGSGRALRGR